MKTFKEFINEGTSASITVFDGETYKTSYLQYDGVQAADDLVKYYNNPKDADKLVQKSGELRSILNLEYYDDRKLLKVTKDPKKAVKNSNEMNIKYYFDGESWYTTRGRIKDFSDMEKL